MNKMGNSKTVYRTILRPLLLVVLVEIVLMTSSYWFLGINDQLDKNARDILNQQTENRKSYLENEMIQKWSNLNNISQKINQSTQSMLDQNLISLDTLDSSSKACAPLVNDIAKDLISTLYSKEATGIFVVFNSHGNDHIKEKSGIYIRNEDPKSVPVKQYSDLLLEKAPVEVVRSLSVSTDTNWESMFDLESEEKTFFNKPYKQAYNDQIKMDAKEYGYWSEKTYHLKNDSDQAISYSVPLILEDGTVYGVVGVELLVSYLEELMPIEELQNENKGSYLLSIEAKNRCTPLVLSSSSLTKVKPFSMMNDSNKNNYVSINGKKYYASIQSLNIYNSNGPFSSQHWQLISLVEQNQLYTFSNHIFYLQISMIILVGIVSLIGIFYVSKKISNPISALSKEVATYRKVQEIPELLPTGIQEIDQFSNAITELSQEVLETSTKFLNIMNMASIDLGGYEIKKESDSVYVTDNFFTLLGLENITLPITLNQFYELFNEVENNYEVQIENKYQKVYCIKKYAGLRYIRLKIRDEKTRQIGIAEDITTSYLERKRIEHERDFDILTGLYNRFSFQKQMDDLFLNPNQLKIAALVMIDLDNLKKINDAYGHDWGDSYIRQCGRCFKDHVPENTICARVSGDEFYLFFYGYDSQEEIRYRLKDLTSCIQQQNILLPSGQPMALSASMGVSWYPQDSTHFEFLKKYADFAMYQIKKTTKGEMAEFNKSLYYEENQNQQRRLEFYQLLDKKQLTYHFQPILSAKEGHIIAYEALMRSQLATLKNPEMILKIARAENKLEEVEKMCIFKSTEIFDQLRKEHLIDQEAMLFINSIASVSLNDEDRERYHQYFSHIQSKIVVEVTEEENMSQEALKRKRETKGFSGMFALDDYGSGYNTEINLLNLNPKYIKIDLSIIRDIDKDKDKQQIVSNIVEYAHKKDAYIIAEGIETKEELIKVLDLNVDYLQGYYLSYPQSNPQVVSNEALTVIKNYWKG